jgi:excisionase family DNA binding protein
MTDSKSRPGSPACKPPAGLPDLVRHDQLAAWLGVSVRTVRRWAESGELPRPCLTLGAQIWFRAADVAHLIERQAGAGRR